MGERCDDKRKVTHQNKTKQNKKNVHTRGSDRSPN